MRERICHDRQPLGCVRTANQFGFPSFNRRKNGAGDVFHTYSSDGRGLDMFLTAYHYLDIVPRGRDEGGLSHGMEWLRYRARYEHPTFIDPYATPTARSSKIAL